MSNNTVRAIADGQPLSQTGTKKAKANPAVSASSTASPTTADGVASGVGRNQKQAPRSPRPNAGKKNMSMFLRQWHQRGGLFAFLFMGWLGISGFLLNQSASWGLDAIRVGSQTLMAMYGLHPEVPDSGYKQGGHWLATTTENTVVDGHVLDSHIPSPLGFAAVNIDGSQTLFVATKDKVTVLDTEGRVIDELSDYLLPVGAVSALGTTSSGEGDASTVVVKGERSYTSRDGIAWVPLQDDSAVSWSQQTALSEGIKSQVEPFARPTVALEQVLIDLHSGRLFGRVGPWVINTVGVICVWLSISGVWMMWRANKRKTSARRR